MTRTALAITCIPVAVAAIMLGMLYSIQAEAEATVVKQLEQRDPPEFVAIPLTPAITDRETVWSEWLAAKLASKHQVTLPDGGRVDMLSTVYATEVDWMGNWEQAIGQSLYYAAISNASPRIILLRRHEPNDVADYLRCKLVCSRHSIELRVVDARTGEFEQ